MTQTVICSNDPAFTLKPSLALITALALRLSGCSASFEEDFKKRMLHTSDKKHKGIYTQLHSSHKCTRADIMGAKHCAPSERAREVEREVAHVEKEKKYGGLGVGVTLIDRWLPLSPPLVSDTLPVAPSLVPLMIPHADQIYTKFQVWTEDAQMKQGGGGNGGWAFKNVLLHCLVFRFQMFQIKDVESR